MSDSVKCMCEYFKKYFPNSEVKFTVMPLPQTDCKPEIPLAWGKEQLKEPEMNVPNLGTIVPKNDTEFFKNEDSDIDRQYVSLHWLEENSVISIAKANRLLNDHLNKQITIKGNRIGYGATAYAWVTTALAMDATHEARIFDIKPIESNDSWAKLGRDFADRSKRDDVFYIGDLKDRAKKLLEKK